MVLDQINGAQLLSAAPVTADLSGNDSVTTGEGMYQNLPGVMVGIGY